MGGAAFIDLEDGLADKARSCCAQACAKTKKPAKAGFFVVQTRRSLHQVD